MPEETKDYPKSRMAKYWGGAQKTFVQRYRVIIVTVSVLVMLGVVGFAIARIGFNYDGVSQATRQKLAKKEATAALSFGLTGQASAPNVKDVVHLTPAAWQKEITTSIQQALNHGDAVADQVDFDGKTYHKSEVMAALSRHYLATLQHDRHYRINQITFDRYHNATVSYTVVPIDLPAAQKKVRDYVDGELNKKADDVHKLSEPQLRLVAYAMVSDNWQNVLQNQLPIAKPIQAKMTLLYTGRWLHGDYQVSKETLNNILNTGLAE